MLFVFNLEDDGHQFVLSDGQIVSGSKVKGGSTKTVGGVLKDSMLILNVPTHYLLISFC